MAKSFIHYRIQNSNEYGYIYTPKRIDGVKVNEPVYLGKVLDKEQGIFKNKERGIFKYTISKGYEKTDYTDFKNVKENLILDFGDVYAFHEAIKSTKYYNTIANILPKQIDTLFSMIYFKTFGQYSNSYAQDWWEGSYANILFPKAQLTSQRVSEFMFELGDENIQRKFFIEYLKFFKDQSEGILIDSTGLENSIDTFLTAISNHCGKVNNEMRLILVIDRRTNLPLFFRYIPGNIVDVTTLANTVNELKLLGIDTKFVIVDAGYSSEENITMLFEERISFMTRLATNRTIYKELILGNIKDLESQKYSRFYKERYVHIKKVKINLYGYDAYAYICIDCERREKEIYKYVKEAKEKDIDPSEMDEKIKSMGTFILITPSDINEDELLPLYYTRQEIEQYFDIEKSYAGLLPIRAHDERGIRGHLMLTHLVSIVHVMVKGMLTTSKQNILGSMCVLRNLKCKVYDDIILINEPTKKIKEVFSSLNIKVPNKINIP